MMLARECEAAIVSNLIRSENPMVCLSSEMNGGVACADIKPNTHNGDKRTKPILFVSYQER